MTFSYLVLIILIIASGLIVNYKVNKNSKKLNKIILELENKNKSIVNKKEQEKILIEWIEFFKLIQRGVIIGDEFEARTIYKLIQRTQIYYADINVQKSLRYMMRMLAKYENYDVDKKLIFMTSYMIYLLKKNFLDVEIPIDDTFLILSRGYTPEIKEQYLKFIKEFNDEKI